MLRAAIYEVSDKSADIKKILTKYELIIVTSLDAAIGASSQKNFDLILIGTISFGEIDQLTEVLETAKNIIIYNSDVKLSNFLTENLYKRGKSSQYVPYPFLAAKLIDLNKKIS